MFIYIFRAHVPIFAHPIARASFHAPGPISLTIYKFFLKNIIIMEMSTRSVPSVIFSIINSNKTRDFFLAVFFIFELPRNMSPGAQKKVYFRLVATSECS